MLAPWRLGEEIQLSDTCGLSIEGLTQRYGDHAALCDVSFAVHPGERLALLGPTGSGKTTLLRIVCGLDRPSSGHVVWAGNRLDHVPPRERGVGMVFQDHTLYPHLSVRENMDLALPRGADPRQVERLSDLLEIGDLLERLAAGLSGGERQRVAIARALLPNPRVLCLDEPFSNLDVSSRARLRNTLLELHAEFPTTWLLVTHDPRDAALMGQRTVVLDQGRVLQMGVSQEVRQQPNHLRVAALIDDPPWNLVPCDGRIAGIRPDSVELDAAGNSPSTREFPMAVRSSIPAYGRWRVEGLCRGAVFLAILDQEVAAASELTLRVREEAILWFDEVTGERIFESRCGG